MNQLFKNIIVAVSTSLLFAGCAKQGINDGQSGNDTNLRFYASIEPQYPSTKVTMNRDHDLSWSTRDEISLFRTHDNMQYYYEGVDTDGRGVFIPMYSYYEDPSAMLGANYAVYPYNPENSMDNNGIITLFIPDRRPDYSSRMENVMVAVTENIDDNALVFKNVCGFLCLNMFSEAPMYARSVIFRGNNDEKVAGKAYVTVSRSEDPVVVMDETATAEIVLGTTHMQQIFSTNCVFCIPPTTFEKGFTVTVVDDFGSEHVFRTDKPQTITRNVCKIMPDITVKKVSEISLDKTELELHEGDVATLLASVVPEDATNNNLVWTSSDDSVATVNDGTVTAVSTGTVTIAASTLGGEIVSKCEVTILGKILPVENITLDRVSVNLGVGSKLQLNATVLPENASDKTLVWTSSNDGVATVSGGMITALSEGKATITATSADGGKTATCSVLVAKVTGTGDDWGRK